MRTKMQAGTSSGATTPSYTASSLGRALRQDRWVRPYLLRYKKPLASALALSVLSYLFAAGLMFVSGYLISGSATLPASVLLMHLALIYVRIFGLGKPVLQYLERLTSHNWILRVTSSLRLRLYQSLEGQAGLGRVARRTGDVLGLLSEDLGHLQDMYLRCILPTVTAWVLWLITALVLGAFTPLVAMAMFVVMGIQIVLVPLVAVLTGAARRARIKAMKNEMYAELTDNVLGVSDWVFSGRADEYLTRHARAHAELRELVRREARATRLRDLVSQILFAVCVVTLLVWAASYWGGIPATDVHSAANYIAAFVLCFFPLIEAFAPLPTAALDAVQHADSVARLNELSEPKGNWEVTNADVRASTTAGARISSSVGDLAEEFLGQAIDPSAGDSGQVTKPAAGTSVQAIESATGSSVSATKAAATRLEQAAGLILPTAPLDICIEGVTFAYPGTDQSVLRDVNLVIPHGQKVAVLGRSGVGKSTLAALVRGDVVPQQGRVRLGGVPASSLGDVMPRYVGVIQQDTYIFNDTLLANLRVGNPAATEEDAWRVLDQVGLRAMAQRLEKGLVTMVDEAGKRFSGGERHRIALARVLLQDAPVVILDEPTVGLDPLTEQALLDTLFEVLDGCTIIMVTHHLQGVAQMDRVVFVEDGGIALDGAPEALAATSERYRSLLAFDQGM